MNLYYRISDPSDVRNLQDVRGGLTITNNNAATVADHPRVYA